MTTNTPETPQVVAPGKRVALYLRSSTTQQDLGNQRPDLLRIVAQRGLAVVRVYEEQISAAKRRPAFDALLVDAHAGRFDYVLVWSIDRLGRTMAGNLTTILALDRVGVTVISARESWLDAASPVRPLLIGIFSWVAEQERARIGERTRAGLARAKAKGIRIGRPPKRLDVERLRSLRESGHSFREIARLVGAGASTIHRLLAADEVLRRAVPKSGAFGNDSIIPEPLVAEPRFTTDRFSNAEDDPNE
jgi:putative DNA-invertase from lambdoid prophage Rac